jgi:hypothetical protein
LEIPEGTIAFVAILGMGIGLLLDYFRLKAWIERIYQIPWRYLIGIYLFLSLIAVAFFMGFPIGNLILGTAAGLYVGRRSFFATPQMREASTVVRASAIFTAAVTSGESFPIGLMALRDDEIRLWLSALSGLEPPAFAGPWASIIIVLLCMLLFAIQFWLTRSAAYAIMMARPRVNPPPRPSDGSS